MKNKDELQKVEAGVVFNEREVRLLLDFLSSTHSKHEKGCDLCKLIKRLELVN
jgi:hypothetical protein